MEPPEGFFRVQMSLSQVWGCGLSFKLQSYVKFKPHWKYALWCSVFCELLHIQLVFVKKGSFWHSSSILLIFNICSLVVFFFFCHICAGLCTHAWLWLGWTHSAARILFFMFIQLNVLALHLCRMMYVQSETISLFFTLKNYKFTNDVVKSSLYHLRALVVKKIQSFLSFSEFERVIHAFISTCLDYRNVGVNQASLARLQLLKILFMYLFFSNHKKGWHHGTSRTSDPGDRPKGLRGPLRLAPKIRRRLFCPYIKMAPTVENF